MDEFAPGWREEVTEIARLRAEVASLRGERDKLLDGYPEGCTPTDFRVLREGNVALAAEVEALRGERGRYKAALEEIGRRIDQAPTYRMASDVARIVTHALAALTPTEDRP